MDDQLQREFLAEAEELIETLIGDTLALRARRGKGRARRELIGRIFRHVHTLKGSAAAAELNATADIAHEFESLLDQVRLGHANLDDATMDAFDDATNAISQSLSAVARGEAQPSFRTLIERLRHLALTSETAVVEPPASLYQILLNALPEDIRSSLSEYELHRFGEAAAEGARLFVVTVNFDLATFDERFRDLSEILVEVGEIISTLPGLEASAPDQIRFRLVYAADAGREDVAARLLPFAAGLTELSAEEQQANPTDADETGYAALAEDEDSAPASTLLAPLSTLVRVELDELDDIISAAHELSTDTTSAFDLTLQQNSPRDEIELRMARVRRRFNELEERLIGLRMVTIAQTLQRAARAGAMAARLTEKAIDFETTGGSVRLDKSLADAVSDPLLHLLRNAVDHGIESPPERERAGKVRRGRVRLDAIAEGNRVRLRITDDGRGIDPQRIARAAVEKGILEANALVTKQQSLRLIFRPGFSTAASVSSVSGRGVGLDIVESAVERMGGELRVWSELGEGTMFEMLLPTTLALVPSLVVRSGGYTYCVDARHIAEARDIAPHEIECSGTSRVIHWRDQVLPLVEMRKLLAQDDALETSDKAPEPLHVIILREGQGDAEAGAQSKRVAVSVDGWDGNRDVLVRGLGRHASRWHGISGATQLRDGTIALMLDLPRLLEMVSF
ncbi:MAG: chemotaxis protein CheA [Pyrinomonadaceae bacterium]